MSINCQTADHRCGLENPFVSVIIPTLNRARYLEMAIRSIINQDYPSNCYEIIIIDNGSTDDTFEMTKLAIEGVHQNRNIKYIREDRPGTVYARHTGTFHSKGDILIFGDDDAIFEENWISAIVDIYKKFPYVGAVGTKISIKWDNGPEPWVYHYEWLLGKLDYGDQIIIRKGLFINAGSFSIKRDILFELHGFNIGQKGERLIGDDETGLCRKLDRKGVQIAWTPFTNMWHMQQVEKHGKLNDLRRRYCNNGISEAYYVTFSNILLSELLKNFFGKFFDLMKTYIESMPNIFSKYSRYNITLENAYCLYYVKYLLIYRFGRKIKRELRNKDWELTSSYYAPPIILSTMVIDNKNKMIRA